MTDVQLRVHRSKMSRPWRRAVRRLRVRAWAKRVWVTKSWWPPRWVTCYRVVTGLEREYAALEQDMVLFGAAYVDADGRRVPPDRAQGRSGLVTLGGPPWHPVLGPPPPAPGPPQPPDHSRRRRHR